MILASVKQDVTKTVFWAMGVPLSATIIQVLIYQSQQLPLLLMIKIVTNGMNKGHYLEHGKPI